jgi:type IV pilus assembly protein PilN
MIRINLLKPETKEIKETGGEGLSELKAKKPSGLGNLFILLLIVALAAGYYYQKKTMDQERALLSKAQEEKSQLQYVIAKLDEQQKIKASLLMKITLISQLKAQQDIAVRIMDELSSRLPDWVWLTEASFDSANIQVRGNAISNNLIADYLRNLEGSPYFANVDLKDSTQQSQGNDQFLAFSLTASVVNPKLQAAAAAPPPAQKKMPLRRPQ